MDPRPSPDPCPSATREALLDAALLSFAAEGYEATSLRQVAARAGRNVSLIAYHFGNKEGLYRQVIAHAMARFPRCPFPAPAPGESPVARLRAYFLQTLTEFQAGFTHANDAARRLLLLEITSPRPEVWDLLEEHLKEGVGELERIIRALRPDLAPEAVAFWGITFQGCCLAHGLATEANRLLWPGQGPALAPEAMADHFATFARSGLAQV